MRMGVLIRVCRCAEAIAMVKEERARIMNDGNASVRSSRSGGFSVTRSSVGSVTGETMLERVCSVPGDVALHAFRGPPPHQPWWVPLCLTRRNASAWSASARDRKRKSSRQWSLS